MCELKVVNINMIGKLPYTGFSYREIVSKSKLTFTAFTEQCDTKLRTRFPLGINNMHGEPRFVEIAISPKGNVFLAGLTTVEDGVKYFKIIQKEFERILGKALKEVKP